MADILTVKEHIGRYEDIKVCGGGSNAGCLKHEPCGGHVAAAAEDVWAAARQQCLHTWVESVSCGAAQLQLVLDNS